MNAIDMAAKLINEGLGHTQDRDPKTAQAIASMAVQIDHLSCQREIRDTLKMIDHLMMENTISQTRNPIAYRIAGMKDVQQFLALYDCGQSDGARDLVKAMTEYINTAIESFRGQMEIG